jgi:hypothetical protein
MANAHWPLRARLCKIPVSVKYSNPQELARQFNDDEAVWTAFNHRRWLRKLLGSPFPDSEKFLEDLDWIEAEREARPVRAIGFCLA